MPNKNYSEEYILKDESLVSDKQVDEQNIISKSKKNIFKPHNLLLAIMAFVNIFSIVGYSTFTLNAQLLIKYNVSMELFNAAYYFSARMQIISSFLALALFLHYQKKFKWLKELSFVFALSLLMEFLGTSYGFPFGKYEYTELLGWKIFNKVPTLIPTSWFFMSMASYFSAIKLQEYMNLKNSFVKGAFNIIIGSTLLTAWDLTLDPAMSNLTPFWVWESKGIYFGTPMVNFGGWFVTACLIMLGYEIFKTKELVNHKNYTWLVLFYLVNLSLPLGLVIASGMLMPVALSVLTYSSILTFVYVVSLINKKRV